jgi:hypothetical protein
LHYVSKSVKNFFLHAHFSYPVVSKRILNVISATLKGVVKSGEWALVL